ncbi:hypothetical protein VNI00_014323 [Paramarasmius palmivorus]|uniref:DUF6534 domain-containing protein n=1 Tax=Paramarasmius palmivorus TaxID=297713 RepID=A0AAW0BRN6_9AGAR
MTCHTVYHYSILSYSRPETLLQGEWSVYAASVIGTIICFLIQMYFIHMVYCMTRKAYRTALMVVYATLITAQLAFGLYVVVRMYKIWELPGLHAIVYPGLVPMYVIRVVVDALTAVILCVVLHGAQQSTEFKGSVRMFRTLMIYAMNRFLLTTLVVIMQTIVLLVRPRSIWAMVMDFITAHLYVNSFLATLNARSRLRRIGQSTETVTYGGQSAASFKFMSRNEPQNAAKYSPSNAAGDNPYPNPALAPNRKGSVVVLDRIPDDDHDGIKVQTETFIMSDIDQKRMPTTHFERA